MLRSEPALNRTNATSPRSTWLSCHPTQEYNERRSAHGVLTRSIGAKAPAQAAGLDAQPLEYSRSAGEGDSDEDAITGSYGRIGVWPLVGPAIEQQTWYDAH